MAKGRLSVHTENILPVIKKWLYSEKEIFLRELVSNALDAITKLKKASLTEDVFEAENTDYAVDIRIDREGGALVFEDNGIGLSEEEIQKYIAQIAFSGAEEFVKKYESGGDKSKAGIIGNFGLGFYSSFMVAKRVEIESRSFRPGDAPARWVSDGGEEYEIGPGSRTKRGTEIRLILDDDSKEMLDKATISGLVRKYCDFLPMPIRVDGAQVNKQEALWTKTPSSLKREDYHALYQYLYPFQGDPLFYIHLNVDYPFRLQGILFFPRLEHELDLNRSNVKIYCKQVFVTDEAQELIPKFLTVLQGVVDLPDLPLNVSRSYIQNEPDVKKIAQHIIKKVADRLLEEKKNREDEYKKIWPEISPFVKFGMMSDERFYDQAKDAVVFEIASSAAEKKFVSLDEYVSANKDKTGGKIYYATDLRAQAGPLKLLEAQGIETLHLGMAIDTHFIQFLEMKSGEHRFVRVDAEVHDAVVDKEAASNLVDQENKSNTDRIRDVFQKAVGNPKVIIRVEALKSADVPAIILLPEHIRRMADMTATMAQKTAAFPEDHTLLVNSKSALIQALGRPSLVDETGGSKKEKIARQVYRLARLAHGAMSAEDLEKYISESYAMLESLA